MQTLGLERSDWRPAWQSGNEMQSTSRGDRQLPRAWCGAAHLILPFHPAKGKGPPLCPPSLRQQLGPVRLSAQASRKASLEQCAHLPLPAPRVLLKHCDCGSPQGAWRSGRGQTERCGLSATGPCCMTALGRVPSSKPTCSSSLAAPRSTAPRRRSGPGWVVVRLASAANIK